MRVEMQAEGSAEDVVRAFTTFGTIVSERGWTVRVENPGEFAQGGGRFEIVHRAPTVVLDAAHNIDGARACAATLAEEFTLGGSLIMVIGMLGGRDPAEILEALDVSDVGFLVACTPDSPRAIPAPQIAAIADGLGVVAESVRTVEDAVARALALATSDDFVLVTGSLYVVGPARTALLAEVDA